MNGVFTDNRRTIYTILLGVWAMVAVYAILHDQYIVRISPEHFSLYHDPLLGVTEPLPLAFVTALGASVAPGFALGLACIFVGRGWALPKIEVKTILLGVAIVIVLTESIAAASGFYVYLTGKPVLPDFVYPDFNKPILITQTIQIFAYALGAAFSALFLVLMLLRRLQK